MVLKCRPERSAELTILALFHIITFVVVHC